MQTEDSVARRSTSAAVRASSAAPSSKCGRQAASPRRGRASRSARCTFEVGQADADVQGADGVAGLQRAGERIPVIGHGRGQLAVLRLAARLDVQPLEAGEGGQRRGGNLVQRLEHRGVLGGRSGAELREQRAVAAEDVARLRAEDGHLAAPARGDRPAPEEAARVHGPARTMGQRQRLGVVDGRRLPQRAPR